MYKIPVITNSRCSQCLKRFWRPESKDASVSKMFDEIKTFCSDACMIDEMDKHRKATEAFLALDSDATGYKN